MKTPTTITHEKICELVKRMDIWKCPKVSVLAIYDKEEYKNFMNDSGTKEFMKDGYYKCAGYLLKPKRIDIESDVLYDILVPFQLFERVYEEIPNKVHVKCKNGNAGCEVEGIIVYDISVKEGDVLLVKGKTVENFVRAFVKKITENKILLIPMRADQSIPETDGDMFVIRSY